MKRNILFGTLFLVLIATLGACSSAGGGGGSSDVTFTDPDGRFQIVHPSNFDSLANDNGTFSFTGPVISTTVQSMSITPTTVAAEADAVTLITDIVNDIIAPSDTAASVETTAAYTINGEDGARGIYKITSSDIDVYFTVYGYKFDDTTLFRFVYTSTSSSTSIPDAMVDSYLEL